MNEEQMFRALAGAFMGRKPETPALDVIPVPRPLIDEFFTRLIAMRRNTMALEDQPEIIPVERMSAWRARRNFWGWLEDVVPATRGKNARINVSRCTCPTLEVIGDYRPPNTKRWVIDSIKVEQDSPTERKMCDMWEQCQRAQLPEEKAYLYYKFWSWLESVYPQTVDGQWRVEPTISDGTYITKWHPDHADDDDDEEEGAEE